MGWMELVADLVDSLAWPLAIVAIVVFFRRGIAGLLPRLRELNASGSGVNAKFDEEREALEEVRGAEIPRDDLEPRLREQRHLRGDTLRRREMMDLLEISPNSAVVSAYRHLELAIRTLIMVKRIGREPIGADSGRDQPPDPQNRSVLGMAHVLANRGFLEESEVAAVGALSRLRNEIVHNPAELTVERALLSAEVALQLVTKLERESGFNQESAD